MIYTVRSRNYSPVYVAGLAIAGCLVVYLCVYMFFYRPHTATKSVFNTSPVRNEKKMSVGYTLIAPYNNLLNKNPANKGTVYLLDMFGQVVHTWTTKRQPLSTQLKPNGHLVVTMESAQYNQVFPGGGNTGTIEELDWDSHALWQYENQGMHHDFALLDNGNIAVPVWEKTPVYIAARVQGGLAGTELKGDIWSDKLVELDPQGNIVWSWHSYEHLNINQDVIDPALTRAGWTYINGISYVPHNPIDSEPAFLVSVRSTNTVMFIRKRDGEILWRSPKGMVNTQHDPNMLPNGDVIVFDNGFTRLPTPIPIYGSRVVTINPKIDKIVWSFDGGPAVMDKLAFFGPLVGGAQPLPNGNILVTDGPKGHVFEVTQKGEVVWDMVSPYTTKMTGSFPVNFLFKTRRYSTGSVQFPSSLQSAYNPMVNAAINALAPVYKGILD